MKKFTLLTIVLLSVAMLSNAQSEEFQPSGKPVLRVFSNFHTTLSGGESSNAFELKRVYLGYEHKFSENLSAKAVLDVGDPGVGKLQMTAYVKNAYLKYSKDKLSVYFGMISTTQFKVQEHAWGYRYLAKSFQDEYKYNASADLGVSAAYKISDFLSADVIVQNGEGYKKLESDSALRAGLGVTFTPVDGLTARLYYDYSNKVNAQQSLTTFIGYQADRFNIGAEWIQMLNYEFDANNTLNGLSFFTTVNTTKRTKVFARYDNLSSNLTGGTETDWHLEKDGQLFLAGFEYSPVKGIKLTPNFRGWSPADNSDFISTIILNCEIKF